eukprot:TRINITY_DN10788_c0_g2_i2.p1 TRINITY_DN10788_c0_g2~~TRINITY_DN10788_c0_g2_i2.p1  ORF type:complete len:433 (+),score=97.14 TRINITY_DN10788_c0_g2_i2:49-1347(+)
MPTENMAPPTATALYETPPPRPWTSASGSGSVTSEELLVDRFDEAVRKVFEIAMLAAHTKGENVLDASELEVRSCLAELIDAHERTLLARHAKELDALREQYQNREKSREPRSSALLPAGKENAFAMQYVAALSGKEGAGGTVAEKEAKLEIAREELDERQKRLERMEEAIRQREAESAEREMEILERSAALSRQEEVSVGAAMAAAAAANDSIRRAQDARLELLELQEARMVAEVADSQSPIQEFSNLIDMTSEELARRGYRRRITARKKAGPRALPGGKANGGDSPLAIEDRSKLATPIAAPVRSGAGDEAKGSMPTPSPAKSRGPQGGDYRASVDGSSSQKTSPREAATWPQSDEGESSGEHSIMRLTALIAAAASAAATAAASKGGGTPRGKRDHDDLGSATSNRVSQHGKERPSAVLADGAERGRPR